MASTAAAAATRFAIAYVTAPAAEAPKLAKLIVQAKLGGLL